MYVCYILGGIWLLYFAILSSYAFEFGKYGQCLHPCLGSHHPLKTVCSGISLTSLWYIECKMVIMRVVETVNWQFKVYLRVTFLF